MEKYSFKAGIFDMDGVITKTAIVHADAWKLVFDEYLRLLEKRDNRPFKEFTHQDYLNFVDGKPRLKGIDSFLRSRDIELPEGTAEDTLKSDSLYGIGNTKNEKFRKVVETKGVEVYQPTIDIIKQLKSEGMKVAVVSSSKNCEFVLKAAEVLDLFDARVDGVIANELGLEGKPEGDIFVKAAVDIGADPGKSIVFEDAISGVQSGRNGCFGLVVGLARSDNFKELNDNGADIVVDSVSMLNLEMIEKWFSKKPAKLSLQKKSSQYDDIFKQESGRSEINPAYLKSFEELYDSFKQKVLFVDSRFLLQGQISDILIEVSKKNLVVIYGDQKCMTLSEMIGGVTMHYLGNDGFTIYGETGPIAMIDEQHISSDAGEKIRWFVKSAQINPQQAALIYMGTGNDDESAFRAVNTRGASIIVSEEEKISSAQFRIGSAEELEGLLKHISDK